MPLPKLKRLIDSDRRYSMACPNDISVGYGDATENSPLCYIEGTGANRKWYPMRCDSIVSGSGNSAVINGTIYPEAGGSETRTNVSYTQLLHGDHWFCPDILDPSGFPRG